VPLIAYWGYLAASCFEACFVAGASGARRVVEWRRDDFWETALYLLGGGALIAATLTPGAAFDATFRLLEGGAEASAEVVGAEAALGGDWRFAGALAGSFALCFPIFYLSTLYSNWLFAPICGAVLSSFLRRIVVWAQFWAVSAAVVFAPLALAIHYWGTTAFFRGAPLAVAVCPALYGLLLGRLAWILDEDERSLEYDD
ncbi:MAG: hypothetical protein IKW13_06615, partial [Thermoguttaceae bacterium]|nr:hypothetical protein [Thermoguttaceae bacterium]